MKISKYWQYGLIATLRFFAAASSLVISLVVTNLLSTNDAGKYFIFHAMLLMLVTFGCLGLQDSFVRFVSAFSVEKKYPEVNGVFNVGILASLTITLIISLFLYLFRHILSEKFFEEAASNYVFVFLAIALPFYTILQLVGSAFQGQHKIATSIICRNIAFPICFLVLVGVYFLGSRSYTLHNFLLMFSLSSFFICLLALQFWRIQPNYNLKLKFSVVEGLKKSALPLWLSSVLVVVIEWFGTIVAGFYVPPGDIALLAIAQRIAIATSFLLIIVNLIAAPKFSASFQLGNFDELRRLSLICSRLMVLVAIPISIILFLFPNLILSLFGEEYISASLLLRILVVGQLVNICTGSVGFLLVMTGNETKVRNAIFLSGSFCIISTLCLVPYYGTLGAAISISLSVCIQNIYMLFAVKKVLGFNTLNLVNQ